MEKIYALISLCFASLARFKRRQLFMLIEIGNKAILSMYKKAR